jgi:acyl transferase domain-containing protein
VFSLADAAKLIVARSRLMQALPLGGAMVSLQASADEVQTLLSGHEQQVSIAALNGPSSTVIAGDEDAVLSIAAQLEERGRKTKRLKVTHASHSPRMDAMLSQFRRVAEGLSFASPTIPIVSNVTGTLATAEQMGSPEYWVEHVQRTVRFLDGIRLLEKAGVTTYIELGPDGVLTALAEECLSDETEQEAVLAPVLRSGQSETRTLQTALANAHIRGTLLNWESIFPDAQRIDLPTYPFQRQRYWLDLPSRGAVPGSAQGTIPTVELAATNGQPSWVERLSSISETERERVLTELVLTTVVSVLVQKQATFWGMSR